MTRICCFKLAKGQSQVERLQLHSLEEPDARQISGRISIYTRQCVCPDSYLLSQNMRRIVLRCLLFSSSSPRFFVRASLRSTTLVGVQMTSTSMSEFGTSRGKVAPMTAHIAFPTESGVTKRENISLSTLPVARVFASCFFHCCREALSSVNVGSRPRDNTLGSLEHKNRRCVDRI